MTLKGFLRGPLAPAIIVVTAVAALFSEPPPSPAPEPTTADQYPVYTDEARAFLGGLEVGDVLKGEWVVAEIMGPHRGRITVVLDTGGALLHITITRKGAVEELAPTSTDRVDFFYTMAPEDAPAITPEKLRAGVLSIQVRMPEDAEFPAGM